MADLTLKRGDVKRPIVRTLLETLVDEAAGTTVVQPIDLSTAVTVKLLLKDYTGNTLGAATGGGTCTVTNAAAGQVTYYTQTADVSAVRLWAFEYEITWVTSPLDVETIPNESPAGHDVPYYTLQIVQDLGGAG